MPKEKKETGLLTKSELKKKLIEQKTNELLSLELTEEYLIDRIEDGEKERRTNLLNVQKNIEETKKQIKFFKLK